MRRSHAIVAAIFAGALPAITLADAISLTATIRDFKGWNEAGGHIDFENAIATDHGFVGSTIGAGRKPVYIGGAGTATTHGAAAFDQWYRDTPGVNMTLAHPILLDNGGSGSIYTYTSGSFFPIDGQLFGNTPGYSHNYHFTFELHSEFTYQPGQFFTFSGDDDVFVFINDQLVVDLGGVHTTQSASVNLDSLGLVAGQNYKFDFFFAERHTTQSNFTISTSIASLLSVPLPSAAGAGLAGLGLLTARRRRAL